MEKTVIKFDEKKLTEIAEKYDIRFVILFGSRARNERKNAESDMDIAVLAKSEPDYKKYMKIYGGIAKLFENENTDVRYLNGSDLLFRYNVVKDGVLLYGDESKYREYKLLTIRSYVDDGKKYFPALSQVVRQNIERLEARL